MFARFYRILVYVPQNGCEKKRKINLISCLTLTLMIMTRCVAPAKRYALCGMRYSTYYFLLLLITITNYYYYYHYLLLLLLLLPITNVNVNYCSTITEDIYKIRINY
jgi:hypothetical protein